MAARWLILADDLTGAADCAIAFGRRGRAAAVTWGEIAMRRIASCRFWPMMQRAAASRPRPPQAATPMCWRACPSPDGILFKKIDSTLRGQPAAEIAAALAHLKSRSGPAFGIFAPAFPATGRTTIDGRILVNGRPLEEAEVWRRDHTYPNADLVDVLAHRGHSRREGHACDRARRRSQGHVRAVAPPRATWSRSAMPRPTTICT